MVIYLLRTIFLSEILLLYGYNTYAIGKWHLKPAEQVSEQDLMTDGLWDEVLNASTVF